MPDRSAATESPTYDRKPTHFGARHHQFRHRCGLGKWNALCCTRWRCVESGWKVGAALGSHRKCVPWFQLRLAANASPSGHVAVIARCWRSRKATVPKEVLCGARSHREAHPTTSVRMWMYLCLERAASHRCNVGGGGRLSMEA